MTPSQETSYRDQLEDELPDRMYTITSGNLIIYLPKSKYIDHTIAVWKASKTLTGTKLRDQVLGHIASSITKN